MAGSVISYWSSWPNATCKGTTYTNGVARKSDLAAEFTNSTAGITYTVTFTFQESAVYFANHTQACDQNSSVFLSQVALTMGSKGAPTLTIATDPTWWNWTKGNSFSCDQVYLFNLGIFSVNVTNIQVQAFMASSAFSDSK